MEKLMVAHWGEKWAATMVFDMAFVMVVLMVAKLDT